VVLLVRYGEMSLKSPYVRRQLEDRLASNAHEMFAASGVECVVRRERGRLWVHADDEPAAIRLLRRVFGIVSISPATETTSDLDSLTKSVADYARLCLKPGMTFAIRAHRSGQHPYTSQDLARVLGQAVRNAIPGVTVKLDAPDRTIHVEVRGPRAYVFHEIMDGTGGLPLGSQGEVYALAHDDAGMVATWLIMRRGCRAKVAGHAPVVAALRRWDPQLKTLQHVEEAELAALAADKRIPLVLPTRVPSPGNDRRVFLMNPLAGLSDEEVQALARRVRES
jgi:thiamine biosynthesis protein ThiI